ncbi:MAG: PEP-CTERM sorting domain-containing protein [Phycisphaerae bacterium]|nr:PEP-CTERM sorting domain-containing protein [Phycisphaerae bacterium]
MRTTRRMFICVGLLGLSASLASAWGPSIHQDLADRYYEDPLIYALADEFNTDIDAVTAGAGDLDLVGDPDHGLYHSGQWDMVRYRQYVLIPANPSHPTKWFDIDDTTRLKYMMHNLGDVAVPIGHSPANQVPGAEPDQLKEAFFEGQADVGSYGSPSLYTGSSYTGTVSQCIDQYFDEHMVNVHYFVDNVSTGFLTVEPWSNANYSAHVAWDLSQKLAKVILADYYLALRPAAEGAVEDVTVGPGETATFTAADLRDPDNIKWNSDGSHYYDAGWSGISQVRWDLDGDGIYETTGLTTSRTYSQLAALIGPNASRLFGIEVTDDEGNVTTDTATLTTIPEPASLLLLTVGGLLGYRRKR